MSSVIKSTLVALAWFLLSSSAHAFVQEQLPPAAFLDGSSAVDGVQSDLATDPPYSQAIGNLSGKTLQTVVWWGTFVGTPANSGLFSVYIGNDFTTARLLSGSPIQITPYPPDPNDQTPQQYEFDVDELLTANDTRLFIRYAADDAEWYWLYAAVGATNGLTAFRLSGTDPQSVPEPGVLALLGLAALALPLVRRRRV